MGGGGGGEAHRLERAGRGRLRDGGEGWVGDWFERVDSNQEMSYRGVRLVQLESTAKVVKDTRLVQIPEGSHVLKGRPGRVEWGMRVGGRGVVCWGGDQTGWSVR